MWSGLRFLARTGRAEKTGVRRTYYSTFKALSEDAYKLAAEPKELLIVPNAGHVDLYDRVDVIPFDKLTSFFTNHLK